MTFFGLSSANVVDLLNTGKVFSEVNGSKTI